MPELHADIALDTAIKQLITTEQAWHYRIVPNSGSANSLKCWIDEASDSALAQEELELLTGKAITLEAAATDTIERVLQIHYRQGQRQEQATARQSSVAPGVDNAFIIKLIAEAHELGSSDLHFEPYEGRARVRIRIDGQLVERYELPQAEYPALVNQVKIMSHLDIAEKRLPQDGRIFYENGHYKFDIRVSVLPTLHGEKIVMRILGSDASHLDLAQLGFSDSDFKNYLQGVRQPHGIMLISGPTGSGKTTTLYATLKLLNQETRNIITIEDPIEYTLEGINQVQLKERIGLDFGRALRTFLRQDPDVIMVGEIRDPDTAQMAVRAALTGHLVLSTVHTNSAWGTVSRLVDMGIPPYLVAATLNTSVAQRLVRLLCEHCKETIPLESHELPAHYVPEVLPEIHHVPVGCSHCYHTGYSGRKALYEVIPIDREIARSIKEGQFEIDDILKQRGVRTLAENAFVLFSNGLTSLDEVYPLLLNE